MRLLPSLADHIRVIDSTEPAGRPPYIMHPMVSESLVSELVDVLEAMEVSDEGRAILEKLGAQRISAVSDTDYNSMRAMTGLLSKEKSG